MKLIKNPLLIAIAVLIAAPTLVLAQAQTPAPVLRTFEDVLGIVNTFLRWMFTLFLIIAAIFIVLAAFNYLTAGGDDEKIKTAKKQFIYAIVAIVIALIATSVQFVVAQLLLSRG